MVKRTDPKDPGETVTLEFDFSDAASSVATPAVTIAVYWAKGTPEGTPTLIVAGAPAVDGAKPWLVRQKVSGGADWHDYSVRCVANAADGQILLVPMIVPVRALP